MEFYHAVTGAGEDNDLNINDNNVACMAPAARWPRLGAL
jgi:hypothetical protein